MAIPTINEFELQHKLGNGTYATVFKTRNKKTNQYFAIKCMEKSSLSGRSTHLDNLITEIKLLKLLKHKHIVGLNDFFWDEKNIYILLEYCNAGNLTSYIRARNVLPENTCKYFMRQLGSAMQYMRSNNVSHFDLKPQNLLLTRCPNMILKVADFGFAQHLQLDEVNSCLKGSPLYMAPEIILKHKYDARADLWSVGVILYECLNGRAPYSSKSIDELLARIKNKEKIVMPRNMKFSTECEDLLTRLLQHNLDKRITFEDFFNHPFMNLKYFPSDENFETATAIVTEAVECDQKEDYEDAYHLYCKALQYFVPLIAAEQDAQIRQHLRTKVSGYMNRAEDLKSLLLDQHLNKNTPNKSDTLMQAEKTGECSKNSLDQHTNSFNNIIEPGHRFTILYSLSSSSPNLKDALEIGRNGEMYLYEKKFVLALENLKSALNIMVPFLNNEPNGSRRSLLIQQIDFWMKEAESIKALLLTKNGIDEDVLNSSASNCKLQ